MLAFCSQVPRCGVAMEAGGGARFWGREIGKPGHEVRRIPPADVKPFVKRPQHDAAEAEAICEAAGRPAMRFGPVKSDETQGAAMVFCRRELLIGQRTPAISALRGHLTVFGQIVPQGASNAARLIAIAGDPNGGLPAYAIATLKGLVLAPPPETVRKARDFAAWPGLAPRQQSTGGKQRLGATTKRGERSLRRLLIIGANSVIITRHVPAAARPGTWLGGMLTRRPPMPVRVALANKMARIVWALMAKGGACRSPVAAA